MEFRRVNVFQGPNAWTHVPVFEVLVDMGAHANFLTSREHAFVRRLLDYLPTLSDLSQHSLILSPQTETVDESRSFGRVLKRGTNLAVVLENVLRVLSTQTGTLPEYSATIATSDPATFSVVLHYEEEILARASLETAKRMIDSALSESLFDVASEIRKLVDLADDVRLGPSTRAITNAAKARGIPFLRMNSGSLVQLGEGSKQRRIWTAETDATSAIAESIASDKELTKRLLRIAGVPVPKGRVVHSPEDTWAAAMEIGLPVVVKPRDGNHGRGIRLELTEQQQVMDSYHSALVESSDVMVEQFAEGQHHRLLVVGDKLVAAARAQNEYVVGDGVQTIRELVEQANRDPRRGENYTDALDVLKLGESALILLKKQAYTPESVPDANASVLLKLNADLTTDVTSEVHPEVAEKAILAAQVIGLDIAGLDVVMTDVSRPLEEQNGMIIEINAGPGLAAHIAPLHGKPQPVGEAIVEMLFPTGENGRIPIVAVTGTGSRSEVVDRIGSLIEGRFPRVGTASVKGLFHRGRCLIRDVRSDAENIQSLLMNPLVDAAIFESHPEQAAASGLGCNRCDVVVVTSILSDSVLLPGLLACTRAVPADGTLVLPACGMNALALVEACAGSVMFFAQDMRSPQIDSHLANGGRAVAIIENGIVLATGTHQAKLLLSESELAAPQTLSSLLPSIAVAWSLGISIEQLNRSIESMPLS